MKNLLGLTLSIVLLLSLNILSAQSVGINSDGSATNTSAMLDVKSIDKGLLIPRTDTAAVNAAGTPADGLMIYSPGDKQFYFYTGSRWNAINGELIDQDGDTTVEVEKFNDEDKIRMTIEGTQAMRLEKNTNGDVIMSAGDSAGKNLFLGVESGINNTGAGQNTAVGYWTLKENTTGNANIAMGAFALTDNTMGINNTAIGWASMQFNTTGNANTAYGFSALRDNSTGYENTAVGLNALENNKTGNRSVAIGRRAGVFDTVSVENIYIGVNAGAGGTLTSDKHQKSGNVMIGYNSGEQSQGSNNVFLGYESGKNESGDHKLYIENTDGDSSQALIYGEFDNDIIRLNGKVMMRDGYSDSDGDTKIEVEQSADDDEINTTIGGINALTIKKNVAGHPVFHTPSTKQSLFIGQNAGNSNGIDSTFVNSSRYNTGIGYNALLTNTNGLINTALGAFSLLNNTTGSGNTAIGYTAMDANISGSNNAAIGSGALGGNTTGYNNVAMGLNALTSNDNGNNTIAIGSRAGVFDDNSVQNVFIGSNAGAGGPTSGSLHAKSKNVMIGYNSGENAQGDGNVFLGYESGENETGDNILIIENSNATSNDALIYGDFNSDYLRVNGNMGVGLSQTGSPSDALHIRGEGAQDLFRVQLVNDTKMRIYNNGSISLGSNNTSISSGDVYVANDLGIGVSVPSNHLHVQGSEDGGFMTKIENTNTGTKSSGLIVEVGPTANPGSSNYFIALQDQNGTQVGSVTGDGSGGVQFNTTSDRRLKQHILPFNSGIDLLKKIETHTYEMKSNPGVQHIGFIAQELYEVLPNIVKGTPETTSEEEPMMVDYGRMTPVLVAAVKELTEKNESLEKQLATMQGQLRDQGKLINQLVSTLEKTETPKSNQTQIGKK